MTAKEQLLDLCDRARVIVEEMTELNAHALLETGILTALQGALMAARTGQMAGRLTKARIERIATDVLKTAMHRVIFEGKIA
jgi:hypothetical protein